MKDSTNQQNTAEESRIREIEHALIHHTPEHEDAIALIKERTALQRKLREKWLRESPGLLYSPPRERNGGPVE